MGRKPVAYIKCVKPLKHAVAKGMQLLGYHTIFDSPQGFMRGDIFCAWTLYDGSSRRRYSDHAAHAGIKTLCFENGWLRGSGLYQVAWRVGNSTGFNGHGFFPAGPDLARWYKIGPQLRPWREDGDHILVCGNKGMLYGNKSGREINHDDSWPDYIIGKIRMRTKRPIHYRPHPKAAREPCLPKINMPDKVIDTSKETLEQSLSGAWCTVVYASSSASTSIVEGVPVIYNGPLIMCHELATAKLNLLENPPMPDRLSVLERLAWSLWSLEEIASGEALRCLGVPVADN